jgi:L-malate glycosyltransferase
MTAAYPKPHYTIIVPAIDRTGPVNVAFDLGRAAARRGHKVRVLWLSQGGGRADNDFASEVRRFAWSDLWRLRGWVHTHCLRPDLLGWLISWNSKVRLVTTVHNFFLFDVGFDHSYPYVLVAWWLWRRALRRFSHVVCISEAMRRYYRRTIPGLHLDLVRNFRAAPPRGQAPDGAVTDWVAAQRAAGRGVACYVGSLSPRKNLETLLQALPAYSGVAILLCGAGPDRALLEQLRTDLGLQDRVRFAGQLAAPTQALAICDVLVLPSLAEGFPLVVLEAASVGVPSLLSNIAVHRELSQLGFGITFDHRMFRDFYERFNQLRANRSARHDALERLWESGYTPEAGFRQYARLFYGS